MKQDIKAWHYLINVLFNDKKEIPIEHIADFRKLTKLHGLDYYLDFLRGNVLPDTLLEDPWEWRSLEDISKTLPGKTKVLVLKGAAARDMDLYPVNLLRKSVDLDIFVSGIDNYKERKAFIEDLKNKHKIELTEDWEKYLKKLKNVSVVYEGKLIEVHFDLFSPLGNLCDFGLGLHKRNKTLEKEIMNKTLPYRDLENIRKMNYEDYWLYCMFHFLKDYPASSLRIVLDAFLLLDQKKTTFEKLKERSYETDQFFLFNTGKYIFSQIINDFNEDIKINRIYKKIFKIERIQYADKCSIKNRLIGSFSKDSITANGNLSLSFIYFIPYLFVGNFVLSDIDENPFSKQAFFNSITKVLYTFTRIKNFIKIICLKIAGTQKSISSIKTLNTSEKKLITLTVQDLKLTFNIPVEFYLDLAKIWEGFTTEEHLNENINIEKIESSDVYETDTKLVYSNNNFFLKLPNGSYGTFSLNNSGTFFACNFLDIRSLAIYLFYAMALKREDLLLVHAGAIKVNNECYIFPGESSTGKSTFFNLITQSGIDGIGDDTIFLKKEGGFWYAYPTPFMSDNQKPIICNKSKLTRVIDLVKVCGGYQISNLDKDKASAILLHNSTCGFMLDDSEFMFYNATKKIIDVSKQIEFCAQIKFSLNDTKTLLKALQNWIVKLQDEYKGESKLTRLVEIKGSSMEPTFKHGDILKVEETIPEQLKVKDVIGFRTDLNSFPVIHRVKYLIKHKNQNTVITKGDNCTYEDPPNIFMSNQKILRVIGTYKK